MVDGVSGVDITTVLFDLEKDPDPPVDQPAEWIPEPEPTGAQLLGEAVVERVVSPREVVPRLPERSFAARAVPPARP